MIITIILAIIIVHYPSSCPPAGGELGVAQATDTIKKLDSVLHSMVVRAHSSSRLLKFPPAFCINLLKGSASACISRELWCIATELASRPA